MGCEAVAFDPDSGDTHYLAALAFELLTLAQNCSNAADLTAKAAQLAAREAHAPGEVQEALTKLRRMGLIVL